MLPMASPDKIDHAIAILQAAQAHGPAIHTNSFGPEGVVLTHLITAHTPDIATASLDTGRLPEQTYAVADALRQRYGLVIDWWFPDAESLGNFTREHGVNAFYNSVELRRACCGIRKVEPLGRMLVGKMAWITGRRRQQGLKRAALPEREWDEQRGILKFNPLAEWTHDDVWTFIRANSIPYNALHDQGYPSIGCAPCTRAITVGEDPRAGRWWWEQDSTRECGLHGPARPAAEDETAVPPAEAIPDVGL
ncbi:MAG: phosphoadenylyl-sulfate reductase [Immundisolibacter sp.]|nr:phosphoadenylyl-sulfate reductase [Immundisolibacter sp.]